MPRSSVTVVGLRRLQARLNAMPSVVEDGAWEAIQEETGTVAQDMRRNAPFKTGALKDGIQSEVDRSDTEGRAVSTAEHTRYVVFGTSDTEAQDFITPAAERSRRRFPRRVREKVLIELRKITE